MDAPYIEAALTNGQPPEWVQKTALHVRPNKYGTPYKSTQAAFYREVTVRIPTGLTTRRGYPDFQRRRLDMVAFLRVNRRAWTPVLVGIEIKVSEYDLFNDAKLTNYFPYCDLFYLAVPAALQEQAVKRIKGDLPDCGLILVYANHIARIAKLAPVVTPDQALRAELLGELLMHQFTRSSAEAVRLADRAE